jgi:hypothetical protein
MVNLTLSTASQQAFHRSRKPCFTADARDHFPAEEDRSVVIQSPYDRHLQEVHLKNSNREGSKKTGRGGPETVGQEV